MRALLAQHLPNPLTVVVAAVLMAGILVSFIGLAAFLFIWAERKVSGRIQDRLGPTRTGKYGLLQSLADGIKLVTKEDFTPAGADVLLYRIAPYFAFCAAFAGFIALPFSRDLVAEPSVQIGAFLLLATVSSEVFGVLLAGYASANKWSLFGGLREAAQVVSYELPRSLCVLVPVCLTGTLNLNTLADQQVGFLTQWNVFHDPFTWVAFVVFFIVATASCKRAPFDLAEAESELVAGFLTEYSGMRWSYFFLAEYGSMFAMSGLAVILFLGGWHTGLLPFEPVERFGSAIGNMLDACVFIVKSSVLVLVMMWVRWSLPRLRIDQVMLACWKYFLPISCGLLLGVCAWQLFVPSSVAEVVPYVLTGGTVLGLMLMFFRAFRLGLTPQTSGAFEPRAVPVGGKS